MKTCGGFFARHTTPNFASFSRVKLWLAGGSRDLPPVAIGKTGHAAHAAGGDGD